MMLMERRRLKIRVNMFVMGINGLNFRHVQKIAGTEIGRS